MNCTFENNTVTLHDPKSFNIQETLECGQCFRFEKIAENKYKIIAYHRVLYIEQHPDSITFYPCTKEDFENIWRHYFDLDTDYDVIKNKISQNDDIMKKATAFASGIRLLNQEPYECLLSFIISQNNNIPRIKGIISRMCQKYGTAYNEENYFFPTSEEMENTDEQQLYDLRMGFRAKYIYDAVTKLRDGSVNIADLCSTDTETARKALMTIKGVGRKVSDCVLLFSMERREVFPIDVWVKRVMEELYFDGKETTKDNIQLFAEEKWGNNAGIAQQYLFYYARSLKIGAKKESAGK